jgi:hypothetical protein
MKPNSQLKTILIDGIEEKSIKKSKKMSQLG